MKNKTFINPVDAIVWQDVPIDLVTLAKSISSPEIAFKLIQQIDWEQAHPEFTKTCYEFFKKEIENHDKNIS